MLRIPSACLFLALAASCASAGVVYVNQNAPGPTHDGKTWATACRTVQEGVNAAAHGDEVWVARGIYTEHITVDREIGLYGGFAGAETARSQRVASAGATVLDGGGWGRTLTCDGPRSLVDGFTVGRSGSGVSQGTGVAVFGSATLTNNILCGNGVGVTVLGTATLANNTICGGQYGVFTDGVTLLANNIVTFNAIGGVYKRNGRLLAVVHNDVFGNTDYNYWGLPDQTGKSGNISIDPAFQDRVAGDYRLAAGSPCIDAGDDSVVTPGDTDLDGKPRILRSHVDIGAYEYEVLPVSVDMATPSHSAPAVYNQTVFAGTDDGKLHGYSLTDGKPLSGFPLDLSAALGQPVTFNSRPAVYVGASGPALYLSTAQGHVAKVSLDGKLLWSQHPLSGPTNSTPAVTPDGDVLVGLGWTFAPSQSMDFLFRMDERTGVARNLSPFLGISSPDTSLDRSPAVNGRYVYVNGTGVNQSGLVVLNQDNLTIRAQFAPGEEVLPPFMMGALVFVATKAGHLYRLNAVTFMPDERFGTKGVVDVGEPITAGPFMSKSFVHVGTASGKGYSIHPILGTRTLLYQAPTPDAITGLVVEKASGVLAFGTRGGRFVQVKIADPSKAQVEELSSAVVGGPIYNPADGRFFLTTEDGHLLGRPEM